MLKSKYPYKFLRVSDIYKNILLTSCKAQLDQTEIQSNIRILS